MKWYRRKDHESAELQVTVRFLGLVAAQKIEGLHGYSYGVLFLRWEVEDLHHEMFPFFVVVEHHVGETYLVAFL